MHRNPHRHLHAPDPDDFAVWSLTIYSMFTAPPQHTRNYIN
jgi:hypothetical protein